MVIPQKDKKHFTARLLGWHHDHPRPLPWKSSRDSYPIWLSEIMLQQTRVEQGLPYWKKFMDKYPTIHDLAAASEDEILNDWQGLGYYSRARNMHFTARHISNERGGKFPDNYQDILQLKGVGPYTAAAIASFAFGKSHAVVDGNVKRVITRFFGIKESIDETGTHKKIDKLANELIKDADPAEFNQAIMNFGAIQCIPRSPDCAGCTLKKECVAFINNMVAEIPVRTKKLSRKKRIFHYIVLEENGALIFRKRTENDIWKNLYDFPEAEYKTERVLSISKREKFIDQFGYRQSNKVSFPVRLKQTLSHRDVKAIFYHFKVTGGPLDLPVPYKKIAYENIEDFAFPKIVNDYLQEYFL